MKFLITATSLWAPCEEIIKKYPSLENHNFEIVEYQRVIQKRVRDENGKWIIFDDGRREYATEKKAYIQIDNLESLIELIRETGQSIVIDLEDEPEIEIYDGFRE